MESKYKNNSLCIIIPMHNEEKTAQRCIEEVVDVIKKISTPTKLIIVNDGSSDDTENILKKEQKKYATALTILTHNQNRGYGATLQTGIQEAILQCFAYAIFMDSDLTNNPKYIREFAKTIPANYDCVKASRYIKNGKVIGVPFLKRAISKIGNSIASFLFRIKIKDCTNGFRMVKLDKLKNIRFKESNFSIILEELYILKKKKARFYEIPTILTARRYTKSHFTYNPRLFWDYLKYAIKASFL